MNKYIKLIRVKHWLKNVLIFLPLFFSINFFSEGKIILCIIAFFAFSFISSIIYIINDIIDIENDKKHEIKKNRPLASGEIKIKKAIFISISLFLFSVFLFLVLFLKTNNVYVVIIPIIYIVLNILYSVSLKHKPIIDVMIIVLGFVLRVFLGGTIINTQVSNWLYLMIIFVSFYLGFGKRRNELLKNGNKSRRVLQFYNKNFLDKNMYVSLTLALISYSLWCVDPITIERTGSKLLFWTIPVVMMIFQLYSLNIEGDSHGDPIEVVFSDKILLALITIYAIIMFTLLYLF